MPEHFHQHMTNYRAAFIETFNASTQNAFDDEGNEWKVDAWFSDENLGKSKLEPVPFDDPSFETEWEKVYFVTMTHNGLWTTYRLRP
jgi:hypothetical protein